MKKGFLLILCISFSFCLQAQKDTLGISPDNIRKGTITDASNVNLSIYPVPVRENYFTVKCDKDISYLKVTNIIGQDIYKSHYSNPQAITKIFLDNPRRGMYLVTIVLIDGSRIVKKIMVEQTE